MPPAGRPYTTRQTRTDRACLTLALVIGALTAATSLLIAHFAGLL